MVQFCCVVGCGNRSNREYRRFFRLPTIPKPLDKSSAKAELIRRRRRQWLDNIARVDLKDGDTSYSSGYIRICSDHFFTGKPSELTDVENIDWAPTLKMGKSRIRLKGNNVKKEMFGFSAAERRRNKKLTKWTETNSLIQTIIPTTLKTDAFEMEERKILALESAKVDGKKYYKFKKNPWGNRRKNINGQKKKQHDTKSFLIRKTQMHMKMSEIRKMREQANEASKMDRSGISIGCLTSDQPYKSPQFVKLYRPVVLPLSSTPSSTKSPLIHRLTIDTCVDNNVIQSNKSIKYDFGFPPSVQCDKVLNKIFKSECAVNFANESAGQHMNDCFVQPKDMFDVQSENGYSVQCNNVCGVQFEDIFNFQFDNEFGTQSEEESDDEPAPFWHCVAPSEDENERILEMMNEQYPILKEEIKEEPM